MIIREETPEDIEAIHQLTQDAFGQADEAFLVDALRNSEDIALSLVAEDMGIIIGHVLLSRLQAPKKSLALAPLSVAPDHQKRGIGTKLIE